MTARTANEVYYDPWEVDLNSDPYPMFRRTRDNAPLYYNDQHDFYALSRFDDVNRALVDHQTFSSARGVVLEIIKACIRTRSTNYASFSAIHVVVKRSISGMPSVKSDPMDFSSLPPIKGILTSTRTAERSRQPPSSVGASQVST